MFYFSVMSLIAVATYFGLASKAASAFTILACIAIAYEHGFKMDLRQGRLVLFVVAYCVPVLLIIGAFFARFGLS